MADMAPPRPDNAGLYERMRAKLATLYDPARAPELLNRLLEIVKAAGIDSAARPAYQLSERDVVLITYADQVQMPGQAPLETLHSFLRTTLKSLINTIHILPFFPYSSDDGFSVVDYYAVDPALGTWDHIRAFCQDFRLMFDAVFNHVSSRSAWFQAFLRGEAPYTDYFIVVPPGTDLSMVTRPRTLPLLTACPTPQGEKYVWTTFSPDQIDLNFSNPDVLLEVIRVLLFYVKEGASLIRLDAIAFLWKTIGTTCMHLPQTHLIVQLMRDVLDLVAPSTLLVTETNVPHLENISYFGDGTNEAQMVYQFPLPPLALHTLRTGYADEQLGGTLTPWASSLTKVGDRTTFFNFTASHDGIGVRPAVGLLDQFYIDGLVSLAEAHGGFVSYRTGPDGKQVPYELNISYFDAITHPDVTAQQPDLAVRRFLVSQAIALALAGVPGVYFHSLFGSRNDRDAVARTGQKRSINRQKLALADLVTELNNPESIRHKVFTAFCTLLNVRVSEAAFHPFGEQRILKVHPSVVAILRTSPDGNQRVLALHNVSDRNVVASLPAEVAGDWQDLLTGERHTPSPTTSLDTFLTPYQIAWWKAS